MGDNTPLTKKYYSIREVAGMLNVKQSLIRYWEKVFTVIKPRKNRKGTRFFTQKDLENLQFIYFLVKEKGHTLEGAKKIIRSRNTKPRQQFQVKQTLQNLRDFLTQLKSDINSEQDAADNN